MNIYLTKKVLKDNIGKGVTIKYNLGRNKYERFDGIIDHLYENVFTIIDNKNRLHSFSYNDYIMKQIISDFKQIVCYNLQCMGASRFDGYVGTQIASRRYASSTTKK